MNTNILKKNLLIFAHYYVPDVASTGQLLKDLAEGMLDQFEVTVVCVVPSYDGTIESKYKVKKYYFEELNGVKIIRVRVPEFYKNSRISRIKNVISYFGGALGACKKSGQQDYVVTISQPPILGGILGVLGKILKKAKLIYCIQDFNPEQIIAVNYIQNKWIIHLLMKMDIFSCRCSDLIITVGCDLVDTLRNRFSNKDIPRCVMINNWIDEKNTYPLPYTNECVSVFKEEYGLEDKFVIMYSGNLGLYYDLENLIKVIGRIEPGTKSKDGREVVFAFVGNGSVLEKIIQYVQKHKMSNVIFIPYQDKERLVYSLNSADVHWCINAKGIKGVSCPSKFYGIIAVGKPVLGVLETGTEIRNLIEKTGCGLACDPGDYEQIEKNIRWFIEKAESIELERMGQNGYNYSVKYLGKDVSIEKYKKAILGV